MLAGKYRVERVLGVGGMGVVVAATHVELHEIRALKFMLPSVVDNATAVERFLREARAAARLRTEHIAKVHDIGRLENGAPYMVMEYLEGADLRAILRRKGPLPVPLLALYGMQVCEALAEAHALGIIHRDLKPANLFVTQRHDGTPCVKVLDFGISKVTAGESDLELTKTHEVLGSPLFMSPEQLQSIRAADARSDLWSLGVVLYILATGRTPFRGDSLTAIISSVLTVAPEPPSQLRAEVPAAFDEIVLRCLRRERDQRFQSAMDLAAALRPLVTTDDTGALRVTGVGMSSLASISGASSPSHLLLPREIGAEAQSVALGGATDPSADRTGASWGNTSWRATPSRWGRRLAIAGGIVLVGGALLGARRCASTADVPPASAAAANSTTAAAPPPIVASASATAPIVVPASVAATATAAPPATASATATAAPAKARRPSPAPPAGAGESDPFGRSRK
ncbi:Serine/threonine-protein kinase pkn3 [Minicystis rosea]|nr:Serine/threonine-protein kinase pkn3 [Minicystis rosea]